MKRELYDFLIPPDLPKEWDSSAYYFPPEKPCYSLRSIGPAFREPPCMAVYYDKEGNLLFTRFIFADGTWRDT